MILHARQEMASFNYNDVQLWFENCVSITTANVDSVVPSQLGPRLKNQTLQNCFYYNLNYHCGVSQDHVNRGYYLDNIRGDKLN